MCGTQIQIQIQNTLLSLREKFIRGHAISCTIHENKYRRNKERKKQREGPEFPSPLTLDHAPAIDKLYWLRHKTPGGSSRWHLRRFKPTTRGEELVVSSQDVAGVSHNHRRLSYRLSFIHHAHTHLSITHHFFTHIYNSHQHIPVLYTETPEPAQKTKREYRFDKAPVKVT